MDQVELRKTNSKLVEIMAAIDGLRQGDLPRMAASGFIEVKLEEIRTVVVSMQRKMGLPLLVDGYREDAMAQVQRVHQLLLEADRVVDDRQLAGIAMACDLAQEKIKTYQRIANLSAQIHTLTGPVPEEMAA